MNKSKSRIIAVIMAVISLCTGAFGVMYYYAKVQESIDSYVVEELDSMISRQITDMDRMLNIQVRMLQSAANYIEVHGISGDLEEEKEMLRALMETEEFRRVSLIDNNHISHYIDKNESGTQLVEDREYYQRVRKTKEWYVSNPIKSVVDGEETIVIAVPVMKGEEVAGVLTGSYTLEHFASLVLNDGKTDSLAAYIMNREGLLLTGYRLDARIVEEKTNLFEFYSRDTEFLNGTSLEQFERDIEQGDTGYVMVKRSGLRRYVVYAPVRYNDWTMVYIVPESMVEGRYSFIHHYTAVLSAFLIASCAWIVLLIIYIYRGMLKEIEEKALQIRKSEERYRMLEENSNDIFFEYDLLNHVYSTSVPGSQDTRSITREETEAFIHPEDLMLYRGYMKAIESGQPLFDVEIRTRNTESRKGVWYRLHPVEVCREGEPRTRIIGKVMDITSQKDRIEELTKKSQVDYLTEVYNRESMVNFVNGHIQEGENAKHAFLLFDLDKFKEINDTFGHDAGDQVLIEFAGLLKGFFRKNDYVGRIGGDEFVVFMVNAGGAPQVAKRLEAFIGAFEEHRTKSRYPLAGCSIGAALFPGDGTSFEELYKHADQAMYEAKRSGTICNIKL